MVKLGGILNIDDVLELTIMFFFLVDCGRRWFGGSKGISSFLLMQTNTHGGNGCFRDSFYLQLGAPIGECPLIYGTILQLVCLLYRTQKIFCICFDGCMLPLHEFLFAIIWFRLLFNEFMVGVLNPLRSPFSQLHLVSCTYVKVFQYWCKYKNNVSSLNLLLHLLNVERTSTSE